MEIKLTPFSQNDYEIVRRDVLYQGFMRLVRYHLRHRKFNNDWTGVFDREILERKLAVAILPYDPVLDRVVLIEQFRVGAIANPQSPWLIEIIAGIYDIDEKPAAVAKRESKEEAGCEVLDLYCIG